MVSSYSCLVLQKSGCRVSLIYTTKGIIRAFGTLLLLKLTLHTLFFGLRPGSYKKWRVVWFTRGAMCSIVGIEVGRVYAVVMTGIGVAMVITGTSGCCARPPAGWFERMFIMFHVGSSVGKKERFLRIAWVTSETDEWIYRPGKYMLVVHGTCSGNVFLIHHHHRPNTQTHTQDNCFHHAASAGLDACSTLRHANTLADFGYFTTLCVSHLMITCPPSSYIFFYPSLWNRILLVLSMCWNNHLVHPPLWDGDVIYYYSLFNDNKSL